MGIHVTRTNRGTTTIRSVSRPGASVRPSRVHPGVSTGAGSASKGPRTGGSAGTRGDFGADVE